MLIASRLAALRIMHIKHLLCNEPVKWHSFAHYWAGLSLRHFRPDFASNLQPHADWQPAFYKQTLADLRSLRQQLPDMNVTALSVKLFFR